MPASSYTFFRAVRRLPDSTLSCHWLMLMLTFLLIDGCENFWFSLSRARARARARVRVNWFFDNQFKTFLSKINFISNNFSFKNNIIYSPFFIFYFIFYILFFTEADKLKRLR